jgi:hypothetical protein
MTREEFKAKVSMALGSMERETWEDFLEAVWQLHLEASNRWIPVEEELPKEKGKYMFRLSNGDMCYETYYPKLKLVANVTHWMPIVPPRKEE